MDTKITIKDYEDVVKAAKLLRQTETDSPRNRPQQMIYRDQLDKALQALELRRN